MAAIPERVWQLLTEDEQKKLSEIADGWRHEPRVVCPCCGAALGVRLRISGAAARIADDGTVESAPVKPETPTPPIPAPEIEFVSAARSSGMLDAFERTVKIAKASGGVPANIDRFFVEVMQSLAAKRVPRFVLERYERDLQSDRLTFWSSQGICAVAADGVIRAFVPLAYVLGTPMYGIGPAQKGRMGAAPEQLDEWVRGRFGYVPASSKMFLDEIRQKSLGDFGHIVQ